MTPVHLYLLRIAGPEEEEPPQRMLSGLFQSVTAEKNGNYAFLSSQPPFRRPLKTMPRITSVNFQFQGDMGIRSKMGIVSKLLKLALELAKTIENT